MPRSFVVLEYEDSSTRTYAYRLEDERLLRTQLSVLQRLSRARPTNWPASQELTTEGREVVRLEGIKGALGILRRGEEGQARVDDELRAVVTNGSFKGVDEWAPEASEDPEACDRGCGLSEDDPRRYDPDEVGHP